MPVIDGIFTGEPFLPENPELILRSGNFNTEVEVIIGSNEDEGILMFFNELKDPSLWEDWKNNFDTKAPTYLFNIVDENDITYEPKKFY